MTLHRCWFALVVIAFIADAASAHFLFVRIRPPAESGRYAEVYFSDQAEAGDPRFVAKIAHTKLWVQAKPGEFEPLRVQASADRLRALLPATGSLAVVGECTYGVIGKKPFLLRHYPKAFAGSHHDLRAMQPKKEIPFEILYCGTDKIVQFIATRNGKPIPNATLIAVGKDLKDHKLTANDMGVASWTPPGSGHYAVYMTQTLKEAGVYEGKKYDEIREFATFAFAWPLDTTGADSKAVQLFQEAIAARASWSDFPGFEADVKAIVDGRPWKGRATVSAKGDVDFDMIGDDPARDWVKEQLESMALHRIARPASGKAPVLRFADGDTDHPLGRLVIFEGGSMASTYRVKDRQISVVNRAMGKTNMTITIIENDINAEKKFLPRSYTVHYWNAKTGELQRSETIQNRWTRLASWDLPTMLSVVTASAAGQSVKTMTLTNHRLLKK